jgi:hypothetical protein
VSRVVSQGSPMTETTISAQTISMATMMREVSTGVLEV